MFKIVYAEGLADDLARLTAYRRKAILNAIEKQLQHEPNVETRHRKKLAFSMTSTRQRRS